MNKNTSIAFLLLILLLGVGLYFFTYLKQEITKDNIQNNSYIIYKNADFGFNYNLPTNWLGYSIITDKWIGTSLINSTTTQTGTKLYIRNPKWTIAAPYEDLPILIFTIAQWNSYLTQEYAVSAAPIQASELARNNKYVFALPARWDFDYSLDFKEAQNIIAGNPIKPFAI